LAIGKEGDATRIEVARQQFASGGVELALHQGGHQMHNRHRHATPLQPPGRFEAEQPAANYDRAPIPARRRDHGIDIGDIAERADAGESEAGDRGRQRFRSRCEQQPVVGDGTSTGDRDRRCDRIDRRHRIAGQQTDAAFVVPGAWVDDDLVDRLLARQHRGQQDAVIVRVRLGADDGEVVTCWSARQQLLYRPHCRHPIAHDNEPLRAGALRRSSSAHTRA